MSDRRFASFQEFYPFYLGEHRNPVCRGLHIVGIGLVILCFVYGLVTTQWALLWLMPVLGYGFAWVGHFFFEKNRPATFKYPLYSLRGDFVMFWDFLCGKIKLRGQ